MELQLLLFGSHHDLWLRIILHREKMTQESPWFFCLHMTRQFSAHFNASRIIDHSLCAHWQSIFIANCTALWSLRYDQDDFQFCICLTAYCALKIRFKAQNGLRSSEVSNVQNSIWYNYSPRRTYKTSCDKSPFQICLAVNDHQISLKRNFTWA